MNKYNKEYLKNLKNNVPLLCLTLGDIKKFLEKYPELPDNTLVFTERVEDKYFEGLNIAGMRGCKDTLDGIFPSGSKSTPWNVLPYKGYWYYQVQETNKNMLEEIERRNRGEKPHYPEIEDPNKYIINLEDDSLLDQYILGNSIIKDEDNNILINIHY